LQLESPAGCRLFAAKAPQKNLPMLQCASSLIDDRTSLVFAILILRPPSRVREYSQASSASQAGVR